MINFDPNKLNQFFDQQFGQGSFNAGLSNAAKAARLKQMAGFAKSDALQRIKAMQAKAKKDQEYMSKYGMSYDDYQAKKAQDAQNKLDDKYKVLDNGLTSDQASKMRSKAESEGRGGHQPSYDQQRKEAQQSAKKSSDLTSYDTSKMTPHNQELVNQLMQKQAQQQQKKSNPGFLGNLASGLKGFGSEVGAAATAAEQFFNPFDKVSADQAVKNYMNRNQSQGFQEVARGANRAVDSASLGLMSNLDKKFNNRTPYYNSHRDFGQGGGTDMITSGLGYLVPGIGATKAVRALGFGAKEATGLAKFGQLAKEGAITGGALSGAEQAGNWALNPKDQNVLNSLANIGIGAGAGLVGDPLLHGAGKALGKVFGKGIKPLPQQTTEIPNLPIKTTPEPKMITPEKPNLLMSLNHNKNQFPEPASIPTPKQDNGMLLYRRDMANALMDAEQKPHGLYTSLVENPKTFQSPFEEVGNTDYWFKAHPKNPLIADEMTVQHERFGYRGEGQASSGVAALHKLLPPDIYDAVIHMRKEDLTNMLNDQFPGPDYSRYHDSYELLEVYAAQLARQKGYDAIVLKDSTMPNFSEMTVLKNDILNPFQNPLTSSQKANEVPKKPDLLMSMDPAKNNLQAPKMKLKTVKTQKDINEMSHTEIEDVWHQLHERQQQLIEQNADPIHLKAIDEDINQVSNLLLKLDLQRFGAPVPRMVNPTESSVPLEHVPTPMELELTKLKDIKQFQVGTQNIYEIADRLPKEMGDQIKTALDTAKINHVNHLEQSANDFYDNIVKGLGIKKGSKESALVQDFGEKTLAKRFLEKVNIDPARLTPEQLDEINMQQLQQIRPNDWKKIVEADKYFRQNYDDLINQVNTVRKQVYPTNPEKIVPKRQDYYHHFNELDGLEGLKNLFDTPANIDPHLEGVSPYTRPQTKWQAFMQRRGNGAYKSDAVGGYLKYLQASSHSIHLDPVIRVLRSASKTVADATEHTKNANKIVQALQMHANDLAGKTSEYDRISQLVVGRKGMKIINNLNGRIKSNMILGNLGSTLGQLGNLPLGIAKAKLHSLPAATDTFGQLVNWMTKGEKKAPIYKSQFLKERFVSSEFRKFDAKLLDKPKNAAVWLLETADKAQSNYIWNAMYRKGLKQKASDPIKFADYETRKIVAGRGVGEVPLLQKAKTAQLFTPFTLEVANQWKVLKNMVGEKDAAGIITFLVASAAINAGMHKVKGSDASYNPIGALIDGYAKKDGTTAQKVLGALASLNGETIGNIPGGNYIPQVMGLVNDKQKETFFGDRSPDRFGTGLGVASTLFKPVTDTLGGNFAQAGKDLLPIVLPYGGNQIKKTAGGIQALAKGGAYNSQDRLQYPVDASNPADALHSLMFGPTTTASGQDYYNNKRQPLSVKQTSQVQNSSNQKETYNMVREKANMKSIQKKIDSVKKDRRLSPSAKQAMITRLMKQMPAN